MKKTNALILCICIAVFIVFIDQTTKMYAQTISTTRINSFLSIETIYNYGILSNIALSEGGILLVGILVIFLFILKYEVTELKRYDVVSMIIFGFMIGGLTSNILELWLRGEVVDFILIKNPIHMIVTNIADISLIIGVIGSIIISIPHSIQENKKNRNIIKVWLLKKYLKNYPKLIKIASFIGSIILPSMIVKNLLDKKKNN